MTTIAPPNMVKAVDEFYASDHTSLLNDGIKGDTSHLAKAKTSGTYHISAMDCGYGYGHLYSLERPEDIAGGRADPTFASAHDIGGNQADRITVTKRVLAAFYAKDPRLVGVAEFAGTTNGTSVHACYPNTWTDDPHNNGGWDAGHYENHCHVSFKRDHANNYASIKAFMDIVAGVPLNTEEFTMDAAATAAFKTVETTQTAQGKQIAALTNTVSTLKNQMLTLLSFFESPDGNTRHVQVIVDSVVNKKTADQASSDFRAEMPK